MLFIEASAKTRDGVRRAFDEVTQKIYETPELWSSGASGGKSSNSVKISDSQDEEFDGGCGGCIL